MSIKNLKTSDIIEITDIKGQSVRIAGHEFRTYADAQLKIYEIYELLEIVHRHLDKIYSDRLRVVIEIEKDVEGEAEALRRPLKAPRLSIYLEPAEA